MRGPKVVVVGAGSLFFGRQALWGMLQSEILRHGTLAYVDIDAARLEKMMALARLMIGHLKSPLKLEGATDRRKVLSGADFVILSFARENVKYRGIDCAVAAKYGIRMSSGDTIGPGGIFRSMRELPEALRAAADVRELAPGAWIINYINPTAVYGLALRRYAPEVKSFALCDRHVMPQTLRRTLVQAGLAPDQAAVTPEMERQLDLRLAGVNHFTWILSATYAGRDILPKIREGMRREAAGEKDEGYSKRRFNNTFGLMLWDLFGACPDFVAHTKEYVPYWQGKNVAPDKYPPLALFSPAERQKRHDAMWEQVDGFLSGKLPRETFQTAFQPDHATEIVESIWGRQGKQFYLNTANHGAVPNMDDDAFLELLCDVDLNGIRTRPVGRFPKGLHALQQQVLETHELTAEAVVNCDRALLRRAMCLDPLVGSIVDADAIIAELLEAERDVLPDGWYR